MNYFEFFEKDKTFPFNFHDLIVIIQDNNQMFKIINMMKTSLNSFGQL